MTFSEIGFVLHKKELICRESSTNVEGKLVKSGLKCLKRAKVGFSMLMIGNCPKDFPPSTIR